MGKLVKLISLLSIIGIAGCHQPLPSDLENQPPGVPMNVFPPNDTTDIMIDLAFQWTCGDPDENDRLMFDVSLQQDTLAAVVIASELDTNAFHYDQLEYNTRYSWQVTAKDSKGRLTTGPVWSFRTRFGDNAAPRTPSDPNPTAGETSLPIENVTLHWRGGDPNDYSVVGYDVYFGKTADALALWVADHPDTFLVIGLLEFETSYFWKIEARDHYGLSATGPLWQFTTEPALLLFGDTFDAAPVGGYPDDASWQILKSNGCEIVVSDSIAWNNAGNSILFTDSTLAGNSFLATRFDARVAGRLQFYWRTTSASDVFGLRMYSEIAIEDRLGPQVSLREGTIAYYGDDLNWHTVCPVDSNQWYFVELLFDCHNDFYNIFVDHELKVERATWTGTAVSNLDLLYFLTFNNRTCQGVFLDEVQYYAGTGGKK